MADEVAQAALDRAIDEHEQLLLVYQPIHEADSAAIYGAEALLRQRRRSGEIREASVITEAAEENGGLELFRLDSMVVKQAYTDAAHWPDGIRLNVNLSPREFEEGTVLDRLEGLVTSCGIDTKKVNLEITETSYIKHPRETMKVLDALRERGLNLWLDDFGTGFSSVTHLQHFPIDGLKIPGAFMKELPGDRRSRAIVKALVMLAHDLGLEVIAEEVETQEQLDFLLELDCDYIQGFLFHKPMTAQAFAQLLRRD
ncbi:MAG: EAL domain-containing protein [Acidobacteria bacterium]|nr:EAL domain-containing protein [Acidobacteriota bacterium]MBV9478021.1 EAL domain-containing protein [Acidobacteriota bacterium]